MSFERANIEDRRGKFSQQYEDIARKFTKAYTNICLSKPSSDYSLLPTGLTFVRPVLYCKIGVILCFEYHADLLFKYDDSQDQTL